jgi:outer membrane protein OmpA-like peptidoglycan-associated protein
MRNIFFTLSFFWISFASWAQAPSLLNINSPYDEQNPVLSPDGKALYFTIAKHPQNVGGKNDLGDIWVSIFLNGQWQSPTHGGSAINNENYNAVLGFSDVGDLYLWGHYAKGVVTTQGISVSQKNENDWSAPQNISIPYFLNRSPNTSGFINRSANIFVFSAESYNTLGGEDIYVSFKNDNKWSEPLNLGKNINTPFQEMTPTLSEDGHTLYFASNGRGGLGSFDLFVSNRLDESWEKWSTPIGLGEQVNSESRELYFRKYEERGYSLFTSTHDSNRYGVIKVLADSVFEAKPKIDTLLKIREKDYSRDTTNAILLFGKVTNAKTKVGIPAALKFRSDSSFSILASANGQYKVSIPSTKAYTIEIELKGYVNVVERLDLKTIELNALEMSFSLQPIEVGALVNLKSVLFYMGTTALLEESFAELDAVVDFMKINPKVEIELEGHTDNRGDAKKNVVLSQQRVAKIKSYLVSKGIPSKRIKGKGFGGSRPIASSDSEEARKMNRRVDFLITKN